MKGRKPNPAAALNVVEGGFPAASPLDEPDWTTPFPKATEWAARAAELAAAQWRIVVEHMRMAGTLGPENAALIEIYCANYARWRLAEANVAKRGPIIAAPKTRVAMHNPYLAIANAAAEKMIKAAADLGLPPSMRGRVSKANGTKKRTSAAHDYLAGPKRA